MTITTPKNSPIVSFLIPTFNAEQYLDRCLDSIFSQEYPKDKIEVFIADGGSTDNTLNIATKFPVKILKNTKKIAEYGKFIAYKQSNGKYIVLLDADNIITTTNWLHDSIQLLEKNSNLDGFESNYLQAKDFSSINKYVTALVIVDPLARLLASLPDVIRNDKYISKHFAKGSLPVSGANGFIWQRKLIDDNVTDDVLHETTLLQRAAQKKDITIGNIPDLGVYHYYCESFMSYMAKRFKIASKHLQRDKEQTTWVSKRPKIYLYISALYLFSIVGPSIEALYNIVKVRKLYWMWHPFICFSTALIYTYKYLKD